MNNREIANIIDSGIIIDYPAHADNLGAGLSASGKIEDYHKFLGFHRKLSEFISSQKVTGVLELCN